MKVNKTYLDGCKWCNATGIVSNPAPNPNVTWNEWTTICPVCNGAKTILVTEIMESEELNHE